jgi:hypothetical protein
MLRFDHHQEAMEMFFQQHDAQLHAAKMAETNLWSFKDAILDDLTNEQIQHIPKN